MSIDLETHSRINEHKKYLLKKIEFEKRKLKLFQSFILDNEY
jgi:hypothetical protein